MFGYFLWVKGGLPFAQGIAIYPTEQTHEKVGDEWSAILGPVYATDLENPKTLPGSTDVRQWEGLPGYWIPTSAYPVLSPEQIEQIRGLDLIKHEI